MYNNALSFLLLLSVGGILKQKREKAEKVSC